VSQFYVVFTFCPSLKLFIYVYSLQATLFIDSSCYIQAERTNPFMLSTQLQLNELMSLSPVIKLVGKNICWMSFLHRPFLFIPESYYIFLYSKEKVNFQETEEN